MCRLQSFKHICFDFGICHGSFGILNIGNAIQRLLFFCAKLFSHISGDLCNGRLFFLQIRTDKLYRLVPENGKPGLPQHGHILKAYSIISKVHVINPELAPIDMDYRTFGKIVLCQQVLCLFMLPAFGFSGEVHIHTFAP